ncbi:MAG: hypothetical protein GF364_07035, partial [Candidatus Lokiarchaeota archaeon]|nr:hypothetical protein [Candidatus Lokiarchaeota archaeon]
MYFMPKIHKRGNISRNSKYKKDITPKIIKSSLFICVILVFISLSLTSDIFYDKNINSRSMSGEQIYSADTPLDAPVVTELPIMDIDGRYNVNWTTSSGAAYYKLYRNTSSISSVDDLSAIYTGTNINYNESVNTSAHYYYVVVAYSATSSSELSNCVDVAVELTISEMYAVLAGISDYPGTINDLSYCDDDVVDMRNFIISEYGIPEENIITLLDSEATESAIENAITTQSAKMDSDDYLFFQYSGHGSAQFSAGATTSWNINSPHPYGSSYHQLWHASSPGAPAMRVYFDRCAVDYWSDCYVGDYYNWQTTYVNWYYGIDNTNFYSDWVDSDQIYVELIAGGSTDWGVDISHYQIGSYVAPYEIIPYDGLSTGMSPSELDAVLDTVPGKTVCVIDACHSGGFGSGVAQSDRYVLTAAQNDEYSLEDSANQNGLFSYQFFNVWDAELDVNLDDVVSYEEIFGDLYTNTVSRSSSVGYTHHPCEYDSVDNEVILNSNANISTCTDKGSNVNLTYNLNGLGQGTLYGAYYDIPNQEYSLEHANYSMIPSNTLSTIEIDYPSGTFTESAFSSILAVTYENVTETSNYSISLDVNTFTTSDTDGDGIDDTTEFYRGLNPWSDDTDNDGMNDAWEFQYYMDPLDGFDGYHDCDCDGLCNLEECQYDTDPYSSDTDSDGLNDYDEVIIYSTDPTLEDTDDDGLIDGLEITHSTNPNNPDSDSDGLKDGEEVNLYGTNPNNGDSDGDGWNDGIEISFGT